MNKEQEQFFKDFDGMFDSARWYSNCLLEKIVEKIKTLKKIDPSLNTETLYKDVEKIGKKILTKVFKGTEVLDKYLKKLKRLEKEERV